MVQNVGAAPERPVHPAAASTRTQAQRRRDHPENVFMLVDLGRNDLGRVCEYGSVRVPQYMQPDVFARAARDAGVDGVLILDYPVEEAEPLRAPLVAAGLDPIFLVSPTTTDERIKRSSELGAGFLYVISRLGVTGMRDSLDGDISQLLSRVRASSHLPIALGFGISQPQHVAEVCRVADAAVVGSGLVDTVAKWGNAPDGCERASEYVRWLKSAL